MLTPGIDASVKVMLLILANQLSFKGAKSLSLNDDINLGSTPNYCQTDGKETYSFNKSAQNFGGGGGGGHFGYGGL